MKNTMKDTARAFLKKSSLLFKTDMTYIAKGGFWLLVNQIGSLVSLIILSILFARLLPPETYGTYKYVISLVELLAAFSLTGFGTAIVQAVAKGNEGAYMEGVRSYFKWSSIFVVSSLAVSGYYFHQGNDLLGTSFVIAGLASPFMRGFILYSSFLVGKKNFKAGAILNIIETALFVATMVTSLFITTNPLILVAAYYISQGIFYFSLHVYTLLRYKPNTKSQTGTTAYAKHLSLMNILASIGMQIDKILVFHYLGAAQLAVYSFAILIPEQIKGLFKNIATLALPKYSARDMEEIKKTIRKKMIVVEGVSLLVVVLYIISAPFIFKILFPAYTESVFYSQLYATTLLLLSGIIPFAALTGHIAIKELYQITTIVSVIKIALIFFLVPFYGIYGIVIAILISRFSHVISGFLLIQKQRTFLEQTTD